MKKNLFLFASLLLLVPFIYLAGIWPSLPNQVPLHFDLEGNIDRYGSKTEILTMVAVLGFVSLLLYLLLSNLHRLRKKAPTENRARMQKMGLAVMFFISFMQCWLLYITQTGAPAVSIKAVLGAVFLLFAVIGNYMPNLKPNYVAGFRLPWTLNNEDNWRRTHAIAGRTWVAGGFLCMLVCLLLPFKTALVSAGGLLFIMLMVPAVYSYRIFKHLK
jgi:uncharacterized membrane protein